MVDYIEYFDCSGDSYNFQSFTAPPPPLPMVSSSPVYPSYPVMSPAPAYTSYTAPIPAPPPYSDRQSLNYPGFSSSQGPPGAFIPHSAINLSVKTEETGAGASEASPQILDLTRPIR